MSETINIPRDTTMQLLVKVHRDQIAGEMDLKYKEKVAAATSKAEVDALFTEWWKIQYNPELFTKAEMLEVSGVGAYKFEKYGERFLECVRKFLGQ